MRAVSQSRLQETATEAEAHPGRGPDRRLLGLHAEFLNLACQRIPSPPEQFCRILAPSSGLGQCHIDQDPLELRQGVLEQRIFTAGEAM